MEYASHVWGGSTHTALLNRVESKGFRVINYTPLTDYLQSLFYRRFVASVALFYRYFHANCSSDLLPVYLPCSRGLAAQDLPLPLTPILSTSLMEELTSMLSLSSLSPVNSGTLSLLLYFHLPMT